jgi:hypothetical protein
MSDNTGKSLTRTQRETHKAFNIRKTVTEYEEAQEAFQRNYRRLRSERLAREAAMSKNAMSRTSSELPLPKGNTRKRLD